MNWIEDDDAEGLIALLRTKAPDASASALALWRYRIVSAARRRPMSRKDWKQAQRALADLRRHLAAAQAAEAALPAFLRNELKYREPLASTAEILAKAVADIEGKIALGQAIVAAHFKRNPAVRGNPSFAYSADQMGVARTAAAFWREMLGREPEGGRDADGLPTTEFGRFLDMILDKLEMKGSAARLAGAVVTPIQA